jgi:hypothetical protein
MKAVERNYVLLIGVISRRTNPILSVQERYRHRPGQNDSKRTVNPGFPLSAVDNG